MIRPVVTTNMPLNYCEACGYKQTHTTGKKTVHAGDVSICHNCGHLAEWTGEGKLRTLTADDLAALERDHRGLFLECKRISEEIVKRGPIRRGAIFKPGQILKPGK